MSLGANIVDMDGDDVILDRDGHHTLKVILVEGANDGVVDLDNHGDHVHINGVGVGSTFVVFQWLHDGDVQYQTPALEVTVVE